MSACCGHDTNFDGMSKEYKRRLWLVIAINATMFVVEIVSGQLAQSKALQADALDFFADAVTYTLSLAVIGTPLKTRANIALLKGLSLLLMGGWIFTSTCYQIYYLRDCLLYTSPSPRDS